MLTKTDRLRYLGYVCNIQMKGIMSQNFDQGPSFHYDKKREHFYYFFQIIFQDFIKG